MPGSRSSPKPDAFCPPDRDPAAYQQSVIKWFRRVGKSYPWRETTDPYAILVSEIMLQQTQVQTVLDRGYFTRWMSQFPDFEALARAPEERVLKAWEGLGYYRRARNLHKLAKLVLEDFDGVLPQTLDAVLTLPGIGRYTAGAVLSFAHDQPVALVDGNVARVLARLFDYAEEVDRGVGQKQMWLWAEELVPTREARLYNSGLMELGQTICLQRHPRCGDCPVSAYCLSRAPESLPVKTKRPKTVFLDEHVGFHLRDGKLLLVKEEGSRRKGLWKLPLIEPSDARHMELLYKAKYSITHHRVTLHAYRGTKATRESGDWVSVEEVSILAMPSPYRKAVDLLLTMDAEDFRLES